MAEIQDVWRRKGTATRVLNTEIKKEIIRQDAVDTTRMRNVTKIVKLHWDENQDDFDFTIDSTEYYKYVEDKKARKWKNGNVPRDITEAFLKRAKVTDQMEKFMSVIFEYRIDQQFIKR
jgi:hypothetical protein